MSGEVSSLLDYGGVGDESLNEQKKCLSAAQVSRLTTQGWALIKYYETVDEIEQGVLDGTVQPKEGGTVKAAAEQAAAYFNMNFCAETIRSWVFDFESGQLGFALDRRGRWERELLIHEEHIAHLFRKWMVSQAKTEKLSVDAAHRYLNETLLKPPHVSEELLDVYNISLPISISTARFWMARSGALVVRYRAQLRGYSRYSLYLGFPWIQSDTEPDTEIY